MKRKSEEFSDDWPRIDAGNASIDKQWPTQHMTDEEVRAILPNWISNGVPIDILSPIAQRRKEMNVYMSPYSHASVFTAIGCGLVRIAPNLVFNKLHDPTLDGLLEAQFWTIESMRHGRDYLLLQSPLHYATIVNDRLSRFIDTTYRCVAMMRAAPVDQLIDSSGVLREGPWTQVETDLHWQMNDVFGISLFMESPEEPNARTSIALTADHTRILEVLVARIPRCLMVHEVVTLCGIRNRETVGDLLRELESMRLVHRPFGERKGYIPTPEGTKVIGFKPAT